MPFSGHMRLSVVTLLACLLAGLIIVPLLRDLNTLYALLENYSGDYFYDYSSLPLAININRSIALVALALGAAVAIFPPALRGLPWRVGALLALFVPVLLHFWLNGDEGLRLLTLAAIGLLFALGEVWGIARRLFGLYVGVVAMLAVQGVLALLVRGVAFNLWRNAGWSLFNNTMNELIVVAGLYVTGIIAGLIIVSVPGLWARGWRLPLVPHRTLPPGDALLRHEMRTITRGRDEPALRRFSRRWLGIGFGVPFALGCANILWVLAEPPLTYLDMRAYESLRSTLSWLLVLSLGDRMLIDFAAVAASATTLNTEMRTGHWDLVVISDVPAAALIRAKHAAAEVRVWRLMSLVTGLRVAVVTLGVLALIVLPYLLPAGTLVSRPFEYFNDAQEMRTLVLGLVVYAIFAAAYMAEVRWRVRTLAAGSVLLSSKRRQVPDTLLAALGAISTLWAMQAVALLALGLLSITWAWMLPRAFPGISSDVGMVLVIVLCLVFVLLGYGVYNRLAWRWLTLTRRRLVRAGAGDG